MRDAERWFFVKVGAVLFVAGILTIVVWTWQIHADMRQVLYAVDGDGVLVRDAMSSSVGDAYWGMRDWYPVPAAVALFGVCLALWMLGSIRREALVVALPIALPGFGFIVGGALASSYLDWDAAHLFEWATGGEVRSVGMCFSWVHPCSRHHIVDFTHGLAAAACGAVVLLAVLPAGRLAWRAEAAPAAAGPAAGLCFLLGAAGLIATSPHARDRRELSGGCFLDEPWSRTNHVDPGVVAPTVGSCLVHAETPLDYAELVEFVELVVDVDGNISIASQGWYGSQFPDILTPEDLRQELRDEAELEQWIADDRDAPPRIPVVSIYADQRASIQDFEPYLRAMWEAGVQYVLIEAQAEEHGALATTGPWIRRSVCVRGALTFANPEVRLEELDSWGELQTLALERGGEPLGVFP